MQGWWAASYAVLWILVLVLCVVVVALARQIGTLHMRLGPRGALEMDDEGPPLGEAPQPFATADLNGEQVAIGGPGSGQLLLFTSPGCIVCEQVLPALPAVARDLDPIVITDVDEEETRLAYTGKRITARLVSAPALVRDLQIPGTPYVVVMDRLGVVRAKGTVNNLEQFEGLVDTARRRSEEAIGGTV